MSIALALIDLASEHAVGRRVRRIVVEVGTLTAVLPDALRFSFDVAVQDTPLEGATLCIERVAARARCRACDRELVVTTFVSTCACGSGALCFISGDELRIRELEVM